MKLIKVDDFIDEEERRIFEEYLQDPTMVLMEMSNVLGVDFKFYKNLPFSFFFGSKGMVREQHGIRVKVKWNPQKAPRDADGYIELHGNYKYVQGSHKYTPTQKELNTLREFVKKYKILFAAVWEEVLDSSRLSDFFKGNMSFTELLSKMDLSGRKYYDVNHCKTLSELENCVREKHIFNTND